MPAADRSLGVFETLLVRDGAVQALGAHLGRLGRSTASLYGLAPPADLDAPIRQRAAALGPGEHRLRVDARPSDGIALALRMQAPIYVSDKIVLEETVADKKAEAEESQRFKKFIEELRPSDFKE